MLGLYDYDNATYDECIDDLNEAIKELEYNAYPDFYDDSAEALKRRGIRIQNIAERLQELEDAE